MSTITKESTIEEAIKSVSGTRTMLVMKFKPFLEPGFGIDDLFSVADEGILNAWKTWDPDKSKFNTYAFNYISWFLNDYMNDMNSRFKTNSITTYELTREGQSYKEIKEAGKSKSDEFNKSYHPDFELDGSDEAKARINRDTFNAYVRFETAKRRPISMINDSQFQLTDAEDFDIFDTVAEEHQDNEFKFDNFSIPKDEFEDAISHLDDDKKKIATMILEGKTISEISSEFGITQNQFMQRFAGESSGKVGKEKARKLNARAELAARARKRKQKAKRVREFA